jgi:hypothetical protein
MRRRPALQHASAKGLDGWTPIAARVLPLSFGNFCILRLVEDGIIGR